ncbi:MAG: hypothetical protein ILP24_07835, partial [Paludibacteraceae bacterium]|nr:hypothetical protein [Paludibacteraceae bacterium]
MGFNDILKKLFGNKSQRDLKEIMPYVNKINQCYENISKLSNDELRAKTLELKAKIKESATAER